jgi:alpha-L-rhamnosidase
MKRWLGLMVLVAAQGVAWAAGNLKAVELRCELREDPLGVDRLEPRLSWVLEAASTRARGQRQSAYQVLVASTPDLLEDNVGNRWDTGRAASDQSIHVRYAGQPLSSHSQCFWKVRVWDQEGRASGWSQPARWTMGLLKPSDWKGRWIGRDEKETTNQLKGAKWIWHPDEAPEKSAPVGTRWFRYHLGLPQEDKLVKARFLVASDNEGVVYLNGQEVGKSSNFKAVTVIALTEQLRPGDNVLAVAVRNVGDTPNPAGLVGEVRVELAGGKTLTWTTDEHWKTSDKEAAGWERVGFDEAGWSGAKVLGAVGMAPWKEVLVSAERRLPARWLRKEFAAETRVQRATLYVCGLGLSEIYLNGRRVGDEVLSPALSEYPKRVYYVTHDVTSFMRRGANAIGAILGNGRYYAPRKEEPTGTQTYGFPKLLLHLRLDLVDGTSTELVSDAGWKLTCEGPIRANNEYDGEEYDARMELGDWTVAGYDDRHWSPPQLVAGPQGQVVSQMISPIRVTGTLKPVRLSQPKPGVYIYDLGQNMVGWCRLKVSGSAGTTVTLRHAETLKPDGTLYLDNLRGAKVTDRYTLKGQGTETYEPRFTYHGFRYVELTGYPGQPTLTTLEGRVVNDDLETAGEFECSQPILNRIHQNVRWGVRGNYRSIPTDCPQRDERQGWLGDRAAECRGETYLFRNAPLYAKWVQDMTDAQKDNGSIPDVCPSYWPLYNDNVTWPSALILVPGMLLDQYADTDTLARHYPALVKWIEHMNSYSTNSLLPRDTYGDWCVPPEDAKLIHSKDPARKTAGPFLGTAYFHHCLKLMARYASQLNKPEDAQRFNTLAENYKTGLNATFLRKELGRYDNGAQTTSVLPLAFGLVPEDQRGRVFDHLVKKITTETDAHIGTGLIGGQWLNRVLTEGGRPDLSYTFATNRTYPSWGYMIEKGATTVWELWNGDTADPAMNSGNHVMLVGDLVIWMYEHLAGIRPDPEQPGFKHILMRPVPVGDLQYVQASHRSAYGWIRSHWRVKDTQFLWETTIPPNTRATVFVPARDAAAVRVDGRAAGQATGVRFVRQEKDRAVFEVGSGHYRWQSTGAMATR